MKLATTCQIATNAERPIDLAVTIPARDADIEGDWSIPLRPRGVILLASGTGDTRLGRRNREVAQSMYDAGYATLVLDLLTPDEEQEDRLTGVFHDDIGLLAGRLMTATEWVRDKSALGDLPRGYLMSGNAAAAALVASALNPHLAGAIVSRGGRPDLAGTWLSQVDTPVLLLAGGADTRILGLNRWALRRLDCQRKLTVVPGASHLFDENGSLAAVCRLARQWFDEYLTPSPPLRLSAPEFESSRRSMAELVPQ